ncbi:uncharacterized protein LOC144642520 isoform X2 [Oculina patagonica]
MAAFWKKTKKKENLSDDQDVKQTINRFQCHLKPMTQKFTCDDGRVRELFALDGTIPVKIRGVTYNIPVSVRLQEDHPNVPPMVYVTPTSSMAIRESQYVNTNGRVNHPYLQEWNEKNSTIEAFLQIMCEVFAERPPVFKKSALNPDSQKQGKQQPSPASNRALLYEVRQGSGGCEGYCDQDVEHTIKHFQCHLLKKTLKITCDDGRERKLFALEGTIPVKIRGVTYNIPVSVRLQEDHPNVPPMVYVTPTSSMAIRESQYVNTNGRVFHPYLHEWNKETSTIKAFLQILCDVFAERPPVYAKKSALNPDSQRQGQQQSSPASNRPRSSQQRQSLKVICPESLLEKCTTGLDCNRVYCRMPYCWQFKVSDSYPWRNFGPSDNVAIEKLFCDVQNLQVNILLSDSNCTSSGIRVSSTVTANFEQMSMQFDPSTQFSLRRLSTPSFIQEPGNALSTKWIWYWKDNDGWKKYAETKNSSGAKQEDIETAYLNEDQIYRFHTDRFNYEIQFNTASMCQRNMDPRYLTTRSVRRRPLFVSDPVVQTTQRKREQIKKKLKASNNDRVEKLLFHGTTSQVIEAICKHNFDHRLHGKNGTVYGEGSYFAVNASYSNNYSSQSGDKTRFMFLASVLTGEYKLGGRDLRRPPLKDPSNPASDLYDSCVDNEKNPKIFVIFNDEQCYPLYLIKYRLREL